MTYSSDFRSPVPLGYKVLSVREKEGLTIARVSARFWVHYLPTDVRGIFMYLYMVIDVYSRKIVGWQIHENEIADLAADLMVDICAREGISKYQVTLYSDNGLPMKGATMHATLQKLGIIPSFSRPAMSNDNPYSESIFKTLKYHHKYPAKLFKSLNQARDWVEGFVNWYNNEHLHNAISLVTPAQRHLGEDIETLERRHEVYLKAKALNPQRWSKNTRNWQHISSVSLNPDKANPAINLKLLSYAIIRGYADNNSSHSLDFSFLCIYIIFLPASRSCDHTSNLYYLE